MTHRKNVLNSEEFYKGELNDTDLLRYENLKTLAWLYAENQLLRSVIAGSVQKPIQSILKDGKPIIEQFYHEIAKNNFNALEDIIERLLRKEHYNGV